MKKELNKENLKQHLQEYIDKWLNMIEVEKEFNSNCSWEMIKQLNTKIETFQYMISNAIDDNFI